MPATPPGTREAWVLHPSQSRGESSSTNDRRNARKGVGDENPSRRLRNVLSPLARVFIDGVQLYTKSMGDDQPERKCSALQYPVLSVI